jgi:hypothetical protein
MEWRLQLPYTCLKYAVMPWKPAGCVVRGEQEG